MLRPAVSVLFASVIGLFLLPSMQAQDVMVTPWRWVGGGEEPDRLPVEKKALRPEFPAELKSTTDVGYVLIESVIDEKGEMVSRPIYGTQPFYERAYEKAYVDAGGSRRKKFQSAQRGGQAVLAQVRQAVIFNPKAAATKGPDATPRLLEAAAVHDPSRRSPKGRAGPPPEVVWATVTLDREGRAVGVKDAPAALAALLEESVRTWSFAPARKGGAAVEAELRVPFIVTEPRLIVSGKTRPPRVLHQTQAVYPLSMRKAGMRGQVLVEFTVDEQGAVRDATVLSSLNPAFDQPALECLREWRFEAALENGAPAKARMRVPITFQLHDTAEGGGDGLEVTRRGNQAKLPPELRYDVAPKLRSLVNPVFPRELLAAKVTGEAQVTLLVNAAGRVSLTKIVRADRPEFGLALQAAAECYEFDPAVKDGRPTQTLVAFEHKFDLHDARPATVPDQELLRLEQKTPEKIWSAAKLDRPLKPTVAHSPKFPRGVAAGVAQGSATIDVLIDETGHPRLPRIVTASAPEFGYAAVQAIVTWQFAPPQREGRPVCTRVQVPFAFKLPPAESQ